MSSSKAKRRRALVESDSEDDEDVFTHKYGEDLYIDDDDRKQLESLPEVDLMQILADRNTERQEAMEIWQMQQKSKAAERKAAKAAEEPERKNRRRNTSNKQSKREKAMEELRAKRKKAKAREEARMEEFDDDDDDDDDDDQEVDDDDNDLAYEGEDPQSDRGVAYDDSDEEVNAHPAELSDIERIRLSRHKLERWCHEPFFEDTVVGCFVRIGIGRNDRRNSEYVYQCAEIVKVEERASSYTLGKTRTRKALRLKHGVDERQFRMEYVSNSPLTELEFRRWRAKVEDHNLNMITSDHVDRKAQDIANAIEFRHTTATIKQVVEEKRKAGSGSGNAVIMRANINRKIAAIEFKIRDIHESVADQDELEQQRPEIESLQEQLEQAKEEAEMVKHSGLENYNQRVEKFLSIAEINQRNDSLNRIKAQAMASEGSGQKHKEATLYDRRQSRPSMVSLKKDDAEDSEEAPKAAEDIGSLPDDIGPLSPVEKQAEVLDLEIEDIELPDDIMNNTPAAMKASLSRPSTTSKSPYGRSLQQYRLSNGLL